MPTEPTHIFDGQTVTPTYTTPSDTITITGQSQPTEEGKRRYEPDGYYEGEPCTCTPKCKEACDGEKCGCKACYDAYADFLWNDRY